VRSYHLELIYQWKGGAPELEAEGWWDLKLGYHPKEDKEGHEATRKLTTRSPHGADE